MLAGLTASLGQTQLTFKHLPCQGADLSGLGLTMTREGAKLSVDNLASRNENTKPSLPQMVRGKSHFMQCSGLECPAEQLLPTSW